MKHENLSSDLLIVGDEMKKKYLTFEELCARWHVSEQELHYLIAEGQLTPSIAWSDGLQLYRVENGCMVQELDKDGMPIFKAVKKWIHLLYPSPVGAYQYEFSYASEKLHSSETDARYRLTEMDNLCYRSASVSQDFIYKNAVFFSDEVECVELVGLVDIAISDSDSLVSAVAMKSENGKSASISSKEKTNMLNIIAALHQTLLDKVSKSEGKSLFSNQSELLQHLDEYKDYSGLSKSNLERVFPLARKTMGLPPLK